MGSVYTSQICHYCGGKADTQDHIVPRAVLPKPQSRLPYWFRELNIVPACKRCNNDKGSMKSDCDCYQCRRAWGTAEARFVIDGYIRPIVVKLLRSPA